MDFGPPPPDDNALGETLAAIVLSVDGPEARRAAIVEALKAHRARALASARDLLTGPGGGQAAARLLSERTDDLVRALHRLAVETLFPVANPTEGERLSILAVGGYGRGMLAPHSDIDLLFLRPYKLSPHVESVVEFVLYALWDLGVKVGAASRTVDDSLRLAEADSTVKTGLLDARLVAGDARLAEDLQRRFRKAARPRRAAAAFVAAKLEERDRRIARTGASRYLVEPNIKDGKGGLRDLNTLEWVAAYVHGVRGADGLARVGGFDPRDIAALERAREFLWTVRWRLHLAAGRAEERLSFDLQPEIARGMGFSDRRGEQAVERFMRQYFTIAREVGALTRIVCAELETGRAKPAPMGLSRFWPGAGGKRSKLDAPGFVIEGGRLLVESQRVFKRDPVNLIRLFHLADGLDLDLHPRSVALVRRALPMVGPRLRRDPAAARLLLEILARGGDPYRTLSLMTETGLLGRLVPEFNHTVGQMQFNMYHAYTVDEHTLRAVGVIADLAKGRLKEEHPFTTGLYPLITDKEALVLAMLLHDTGKGGEEDQETAGAKAARAACVRLGLSQERAEAVAWLVGHHLLMSDTAQKRDLDDPRTVEAFAKVVQTPERLRQLLVLTVADIRAVGPGVWNAWKAELLRELYLATEARFRGAARTGEVRSAAPDETGPATARTRFAKGRSAVEVTVSAPDRDGLFADLTAVLAAFGANVAAAKVATSPAGRAQDVFYLQDAVGQAFARTDPAKLRRLCADLQAAAEGRAPKTRAREPQGWARAAAFAIEPAVSWDNDAASDATVVETSGRDRAGLLADLARTISDAGLSIRSAHIDNYGERAVDAFYVQAEGGKLSKEQAKGLKSALLGVLARSEPVDASRRRARASARR